MVIKHAMKQHPCCGAHTLQAPSGGSKISTQPRKYFEVGFVCEIIKEEKKLSRSVKCDEKMS